MSMDSVKKDNRRALPKFLLMVLVSALVGGVVGFFVGWVGESTMRDDMAQDIHQVLYTVSPWGTPVAMLALLLPAGWMLYRAKTMFSSCDGEDEELLDRVDQMVERSIIYSSILLPIALFFFSACLVYHMRGMLPLVWSGELVLAFACITILQQKSIDLARVMNPEKQGSIYDKKFQKMWLESCDEAERKRIGEASYQAFRTTNMACMVLWVVTVLVHMVFETGLLASFMVLLLLGVLQVSYFMACVKQSQQKKRQRENG